MHILSIIPTYNESYFAPLQARFLQSENIDAYFIDNESTDDTLEWLKSNNIRHHSLRTNGMFHCELMQQERLQVIHDKKPDWIIYGDCDEFFITAHGLRNLITHAELTGHNSISLRSFEIYNTGEIFSTQDTIHQFHYGTYRYEKSGITRIHKYSKHIKYTSDNIWIPNVRPLNAWGLNLNYGPARPVEQREAALSRRKLAWEAGLSKSHGAHYSAHKAMNWTLPSELLQDIRSTEYGEKFKILIMTLTESPESTWIA